MKFEEYVEKREQVKNFNLNYGLVALTVNETGSAEIVHFCGYEKNPTQKDIDSLYKELSEDVEFGLQDKMDRIWITHAWEEVIEKYKEILGNLK